MDEANVEAAVEALEDDEVRERVASGDFTDLSSYELTDDVTTQLQDLAQQWGDADDDVQGFDFPLGPKGASLIFSRTPHGDKIKFKKKNQTIDRTASVQPLGGLSTGGTSL